MEIRIAILLLFSVITLSLTNKEPKELFKNESKLNSCRQEIPLTYKKKDNITVALKAKELKGQELILLFFSKKTKKATYKRYYLVSEQSENDISNFLVEKDNYLANKEVAVFLYYNPSYYRFYTANCFDKILADNIDLQGILKEEK